MVNSLLPSLRIKLETSKHDSLINCTELDKGCAIDFCKKGLEDEKLGALIN